jgi:uncharacterized cupredoxin-like copper-binding protein
MTRKFGLLALTVVAAAALLSALPAAARQSSAKATVVAVTAGQPSEFRFKLSKTSVPRGKVTFTVTNRGNLPHDFKIAGKVTPLLQAGKTAKLVVTLKKGKYAYLCTVSGHAAAGMKGTLTVK